MKRIEITSPQIHGKAHLGIREITGWWSSKKSYEIQYKITEARLEDTVYFVINTSGVRSGTEIDLQLYNLEELFFLDYLCPDTYRFNGKIEFHGIYPQALLPNFSLPAFCLHLQLLPVQIGIFYISLVDHEGLLVWLFPCRLLTYSG